MTLALSDYIAVPASPLMPTEISLTDTTAAADELNRTRQALGLQVLDLEEISGVSASAFFAWKSSTRSARFARSPSFLCLVAIAQTLGFCVLLRHKSGREHRVETAKEAMAIIMAERRFLGLTFEQAAELSGISAATYYPLARGKRDARVATIVAIAGVLGFEFVLRAVEAE